VKYVLNITTALGMPSLGPISCPNGVGLPSKDSTGRSETRDRTSSSVTLEADDDIHGFSMVKIDGNQLTQR
jgi:hypothetical protein